MNRLKKIRNGGKIKIGEKVKDEKVRGKESMIEKEENSKKGKVL